jgi:hypothetical protein
MEIKFNTTADADGMGGIIVDGREYRMPAQAVAVLAEPYGRAYLRSRRILHRPSHGREERCGSRLVREAARGSGARAGTTGKEWTLKLELVNWNLYLVTAAALAVGTTIWQRVTHRVVCW